MEDLVQAVSATDKPQCDQLHASTKTTIAEIFRAIQVHHEKSGLVSISVDGFHVMSLDAEAAQKLGNALIIHGHLGADLRKEAPA